MGTLLGPFNLKHPSVRSDDLDKIEFPYLFYGIVCFNSLILRVVGVFLFLYIITRWLWSAS